jgi:2-polyprenyl-6-hydroxyphenyl methylase/3-demethylubiquinone-9 3-methyltransferase
MPIDNDWYDNLGDAWWDPRGPVAALHDFNAARTAYAIGVIRGAMPEVAHPRVLDVGAGGGLFSASLVAGGFEVVGLDASLPSLRTAREHTVRPDDDHAPSYVAGNAMLLPVANSSFDAVVCSEVLEHVASPGDLITEVARVLRPGGVFCFDTPNRTWYARIALISLAENLGWAPRGTHDYDLFLTPGELRDLTSDAGLHLRDLRGFSLQRSPIGALRGYLRRKDIGGFRLSTDLRFVITGYAEKPPAPALEALEAHEETPIAVEDGAR